LERRNKIGHAFLRRVLALDRFGVREARLTYDDLSSVYFGTPTDVEVQWHTFDNNSGETRPIHGATTLKLPDTGDEYLAAELRGGGQAIRVYVRQERGGIGRTVVGRETLKGPELRLLSRRQGPPRI
jgi:hypothetical protein